MNPIWQDMLFLEELNTELHEVTAPDDVHYGFKPYQRDPRWLTLLSFTLLIVVVAATAGIFYWNMRG